MVIELEVHWQEVITHHYLYDAFQYISLKIPVLLKSTSIITGPSQDKWINMPETAAIAGLGTFDEHIIAVFISLQAAAGSSAAAAVAY